MLYLLDTANINEIKKAFDLYPMSGVTTNPTIISKEKGDFLTILKEIRDVIGKDKMLHVQALGKSSEEIVREAEFLNKTLGENVFVKIPVMPQGIKAMKQLKKIGIKVTATAIFTPQQALIAAISGADFAAPYVNRIDNISGDGVKVVSDIVSLYKNYNLDCKVLAASFKNIQQIQNVAMASVQSITVNAELMNKLLEHPLTDWSVNQFIKDWEEVYGEKKLTDDVIKGI